MSYVTVTQEVDIEVNLADFETRDLEEELQSRIAKERRGGRLAQGNPKAAIADLRRAGCPRDLLAALEEWAAGLGRVVMPEDLADWKAWVARLEG